MDYKEEQNNEIEALDSIYCSDFEVLVTEPFHVFTVAIQSDNYEEGTCGIRCLLKFEYTPNYPEELPIIAIDETDNLEPKYEEELEQFLQNEASDNVGMAMVFTLVSAALEWINIKSDFLIKEKEERDIVKKREEEEAERKKFEGTRVTVETFITWKQAFEIDLGLAQKREKEDKNKKLTGRELFMQDKSLIESDLKFLEEAGEVVQVDESLFQDFDDLEMEAAQFSEED